jgi:nucleotide-binding universal stress UspA family protein
MRVLACVDLEETNDSMLATAVTLAGAEGQVVVLHVAQPEPEFLGEVVTGRDGVAQDLRKEHRDAQALAAGLKGRGVDASALTVQGTIHERILEHAERLAVDYIVLASRAHWAVHDLLVVSVLKGVLRGARVPVVIAPHARPAT